MREMKDSGIEWIGEIPKEWEICSTKRFFRHTKTIVGKDFNSYDRLALTMNGVIKRNKDDSDGLQPEKFDTYQILRENEMVFKLIDLANVKTSRVGLSPYTGIVSPAYVVLTNKSKDNRFYYYYFMSMYYNEIFNNIGDNGVRSSLNSQQLLSVPIVDVPTETQHRIADHLDDKCGKIDRYIEQQKQVIEKLKAYKQSVITEAVTKGL
ncbi:MAG: restriction endonuclease subunit S, partial [Oscillospiraceae bacterium]|nr:restriction endonuclease subunit S [Oscillospiraceae bacterium]